MYKYIFSDLDGTLFDDDKNVSDNNLKAIKKAQEKGVNFILCSGRAPYVMVSALKQVEQLNNPSIYVLSLNGGLIVTGDFKVLDSRPLDSALARKILEFGYNEKDLAIAAAFNSNYLRFDPGVIPEEFRKKWRWNDPCSYKTLIDELDIDKAYKLMIMSLDHNRLLEFKERIQEKFKDVEVTFSGDYYMEINPKGVSKATGIERLMKLVGGSIDECIAIGDYYNDLDMIKACGLGCCPSNANEDVKRSADYICENDNNHDAIAEIINKFILEEK